MSQNKYQHKIFTVPNIISFLRILLIPLVIYYYIFKQMHITAFIILAVACVSDIVDGYIARHFNMISDVGKGLDAIADKLMQFSILVCTAQKYPLVYLLAGLLAIKEIVTGIYALRCINITGKVHGAKTVGKVSTFILDGTVLTMLLFQDVSKWVEISLTVVCAVSMIVSFYWYLCLYIEIIKNVKAKEKFKKTHNISTKSKIQS